MATRKNPARKPRTPRVGDMAYRVYCTTCHYGKGYGAGQMGAQRGMAKHVGDKPHHVMVLIRETTIDVSAGQDGVDALALEW